MGLEVIATRPQPLPSLPALAQEIRAAGIEGMVVMVDGALVAFGKPLPEAWRDVRLRTPAGTLTLLPHPQGVAIVVFGNADDALRATQRSLATALSR